MGMSQSGPPWNVAITGPGLVYQDPTTGALVGVAGSQPQRSALFVGDSITDYARVGVTATSVTNLGDGTANVNRSSHSLSIGQSFTILAAADPAVNVMRATVVSVTDANNVIARLDGPVHSVVGTGPSILMDDRRSTRGWPNWLDTFSGEPLRRTWAALGGADMADIIDLMPKLAPGYEDMAFICIGMNDIYSVGKTLAQMQQEWHQMMSLVRQRAGRIVVLSVPPRSSADGAWTAGKQIIHNQWNRWLYDQCITYGWEWVDTWRAVWDGLTYVNSGATNPDPRAEFVHDNTHPGMRGAAAIGAAVWAAVSKFFGPTGWRAAHPAAIGANAGNLLTASEFATDTAGVATNWARTDVTASMVATFSMESRTVVADGDACGRNQLMTVGYGTATGTASCRLRRNNVQALFVAGGRYRLSVPFRVTGALGLVGLELSLLGTRADGTFLLILEHNQDSNADAISGSFSGWLNSPEFTIPSEGPALTDMDIWVRPYLSSAQSTNLELRVWQPNLRRVV